MARYTGPSWKQSRRLKFSILETGKELQNALMPLVNMVKREANYQNTDYNYKKNKKFVSIMVLMKNNSVTYLKELQNYLVNKVTISYSY